MPFSPAADKSEAISKTTRNLWTQGAGGYSTAVENFRKALYEGSGPLAPGNIQNLSTDPVFVQSAQAWNVAMLELSGSAAGANWRGDIYKYIRAVQYCMTVAGGFVEVLQIYNDEIAS